MGYCASMQELVVLTVTLKSDEERGEVTHVTLIDEAVEVSVHLIVN